MANLPKCKDLPAAVELIWKSMVGAPLTRSETRTPSDDQELWVSGVVQILGEWNGAIRLDCSWELAQAVTARMYGIEIAEVTPEVACDTVAELANVVAGMVKPLLGSRSHHSLPTVVRGRGYDFSVPHGRSFEQCGFDCETNYFSVTILQRAKANG
jgi:CheY-specific phosphatase CheX